jgi:hypothetical protein
MSKHEPSEIPVSEFLDALDIVKQFIRDGRAISHGHPLALFVMQGFSDVWMIPTGIEVNGRNIALDAFITDHEIDFLSDSKSLEIKIKKLSAELEDVESQAKKVDLKKQELSRQIEILKKVRGE